MPVKGGRPLPQQTGEQQKAPRGCAVALFIVVMLPVFGLIVAMGSEPEPAAFDVQEVAGYLNRNFAETTWYSSVQRLAAPFGGRLNVYTDLYPDAEGEQFAEDICGKIYANVLDKGVTEVAVFGQQDKFLASCP